jgi:aldehyde dehydrogenase (NAD+)
MARFLPRYLDAQSVLVVEGGVDETTELLAERFDHIFYTGNSRVARIVAAAAAKNLTPVTLELGGKSPVYVDDTVDIDAAARRIAWGKFLNAGQTCVAPDYVLATPDVARRLVEALRGAIGSLYGHDPRQTADYGRIVNDAQFGRLSALAEAGNAAIGGRSEASERYIEPTVLTEVPLDSPLMTEEIFGPLLPLIPYDEPEQALDFIRSRPRPLALYYFGGAGELRERALQLPFGGGCINDTIMHLANSRLPFGGIGNSGLGCYHGYESFLTFSAKKGIYNKSNWLDLPMRYRPYTAEKLRLIRRFLR